jgi:hypothetical protein
MKDLEQVNSELLNKGLSDFVIDTGSQSFVKYPTNYIDVMFDQISIQCGEIVYGNIEIYDLVFDNIKAIYLDVKSLVDQICVDFVQIVFIKSDNLYRVIIDQDGDQHSFDTTDINELINFINNFE